MCECEKEKQSGRQERREGNDHLKCIRKAQLHIPYDSRDRQNITIALRLNSCTTDLMITQRLPLKMSCHGDLI